VLPYDLEAALRAAVRTVLPDAPAEAVALRPCPEPQFGDYQTTGVMALAKARRLNPRQLASQVLAHLQVEPWCQQVEVAGPGFLNFRLKPAAVAATLQQALHGGHLFFQPAPVRRTIVIDFSSPNVAKAMHVGHIRSTILGDCLARTFRLLGHRVITDNHLGDWGTQFGLLLVGWKRYLDPARLEADPIAEMERLYKKATAESEADPAVREQARLELVKLQRGDPENRALWERMRALSQSAFDAIYRRLDVQFDYTLGESFYNPRLQAVVDELVARGIARESEGAICIFSDGSLPPKDDPFLIHQDGRWQPNPCLIQKSDGGFNYATTDLATLAYRIETWQPDEIIYVTDARQQLHFRQIFATFRRWHPEVRVKLVHVWFGSILGQDGKPLKTRSGDPVKLAQLLDEAEERAFKVVTAKNPELDEAVRRQIARVVGIGAVKYADLLPNRQSDYVFDWDKLLALSGNTAPYLQYAYARIRSIFRKGGAAETSMQSGPPPTIQLEAAEELALAKHLLNFGLTIQAVAEDYRPNYLCNYLFELAGRFTAFYENCPVLKAAEPARSSRLALCDLTARVLKQGLELLGIQTLEQM
jgi:arginyl-tRNA synthetase